MKSLIARLTVIFVACTLLSGCATLTIATIGGLVAAGAITGAGRFAGEKVASNAYRRHIAWKRCREFEPYRTEACVRRYMRRY